jgi:hypothetical protein
MQEAAAANGTAAKVPTADAEAGAISSARELYPTLV